MSEKETRYQMAQKRVRTLRGFYVHLVVYVLVNLSLFLLDIIASPDNLWFHWPLLGWAIGIAFHAFSVFGPVRLLGTGGTGQADASDVGQRTEARIQR